METTTAQRMPEPHVGNLYSAQCPCRDILDLVGSKWSALIIGKLEHETHRFGELKRAVPGITQKMLTQTLRNLERDGLVHREVIPARPPQVAYSLTALGRSITGPLGAIRDWSEQHLPDVQQARREFAAVNEG